MGLFWGYFGCLNLKKILYNSFEYKHGKQRAVWGQLLLDCLGNDSRVM